MDILSNQKIDDAHKRIYSFIRRTPLIMSETINKYFDANVFFKLENLQITGSFKIRGASNKIYQLTEEQKKRGIVAYSSGNHAQAVAYISKLFEINATIVMPNNAPLVKINNTKNYGAEVVLHDAQESTREKVAEEIAYKYKKTIIKPFDDPDIILGQGTVGKELTEQLVERKINPDIYLCCCGGGGLIAGSSSYLKNSFPKIQNYSVEPEQYNDTEISLKNNKIVSNDESAKSICDALLAHQPGELTFPINQITLQGGLSVNDQEVKETIIKLAEDIKVVAEPGGAVAAAALFNKKINVKNKNVVVMISGGNIDHTFFSSIVN